MSFFKQTQRLSALAPQFFKAETKLCNYRTVGQDLVPKKQTLDHQLKQTNLSARKATEANDDIWDKLILGTTFGSGFLTFYYLYVFSPPYQVLPTPPQHERGIWQSTDRERYDE